MFPLNGVVTLTGNRDGVVVALGGCFNTEIINLAPNHLAHPSSRNIDPTIDMPH